MKWSEEKDRDYILSGSFIILMLVAGGLALLIEQEPRWLQGITLAALVANAGFTLRILDRTKARRASTIINITKDRWPAISADWSKFFVDIPESEHEKGPYAMGVFWEDFAIVQDLEIISIGKGTLRVRFRHPLQTFQPDRVLAQTLTVKISGI